jgi:hypothetical protein
VISDYRLPTLSGLEVIESVRQRWPAATAVILSGDTFDPRLHALSNTGVNIEERRFGAARARSQGGRGRRATARHQAIQSERTRRRSPRALTSPAAWIAPPNSSNFSVKVV